MQKKNKVVYKMHQKTQKPQNTAKKTFVQSDCTDAKRCKIQTTTKKNGGTISPRALLILALLPHAD